MRVVSLVPSWTETLIEAGVDVVGRTRFCVHPSDRVRSVPIVGGTKDLDDRALQAIGADVVLLDREENPKDFLQRISCPVLDTHVDSIAGLALELERLSLALRAPPLAALAARARRVAETPDRDRLSPPWPGFLEELTPLTEDREIHYVIWRNPWMTIGPGTYIDSVLAKLGFRRAALSSEGRYPVIAEDELARAYNLFSSEPFPFAKKISDLRREGWQGALVDGECYSWFGVRSLRFLEAQLGLDAEPLT